MNWLLPKRIFKTIFLKNLYGLFFILLFQTNLLAQAISITSEENDAFIEVSWNVPKNTCLTNNGVPYVDGVYVRLLAGGNEVFGEAITDLSNIGDTYSQSFRHFVGPDIFRFYTLEIREIGIGNILCEPSVTITSKTLPFQPPVDFVAIDRMANPDEAVPDRIHLSWTNKSELATAYIILRNWEIIGTVNQIDSVNQVLTYEDVFVEGDRNSLQNGEEYIYEIQTEASRINETFSNNIIDQGNTVRIDLQAMDGLSDEPQNMVKLNWNDMGAFCEEIRILRDGAQIATVANNATDYIDEDPTFGAKTPYTVQLIENGNVKVSTVDTGYVPPIGAISGKVLTEKGSYPIENASIMIAYLAGDVEITDTLYTDESGCFNWTDIHYGRGTQLALKVSKDELDFENPLDTVFLTNESPTFDQLVFLSDTEYPEIANTIEFSGFNSNGFDQKDYVELNWEYTSAPNKITYFNIYRSGVLIARLNDRNGTPVTTYIDKTGVPAANYTYEINYFRIENGALIDSSSQAMQLFPAVTKVPTLTADFDNTGGKVDLNWTHPSDNFTGFYIFRDTALIDSLPKTATSFTDLSGESNQSYTYKIAAYRNIGMVSYVGEMTAATVGTYPTLLPPLDLEVFEVDNASFAKVKWTIPNSLTPSYNYSGFRVYRKLAGNTGDFELLGIIDKYFISESAYEFSDFTGKSGVNYEYEVRTFVETPSSFYEASTGPEPFTYPDVFTNINAGSTSSDENSLTIRWFNANLPEVNIDGYVVSKGSLSDSIATRPYGGNGFTYYLASNEYGQNITFFIRAYRVVDGSIFYSSPLSRSAQNVVANVDNSPQAPTQVTATNDLAGLIKVCWEYPTFIQSDFKVYRNKIGGTKELVSEITTTERAYYDYDVEPGVPYQYTIVANYQGDESSPIKTLGKARQFNRLSGRIYSHQTGIGTPDVKVELIGTSTKIIFGRFFSDSTGYYLFEDIPVPSGTNMTIRVTGINTDFDNTATIQASTTQMFTIEEDLQNYEYDFINYYEPARFPVDTVDTPGHFIAAANYATMNVDITWSPKDDNYSGFIIFRGLTDNDVLGEVKRGEPFQLIDEGGAPGFEYIYAIQAYLDTPTGRTFSLKKITKMIYPILLPVQHLMANEVRGANQVALRWGHLLDNHDRYVVTRNNSPVAAINTGERLEYIDSTGIPGEQYLYAVYAERKANGETYLSEVRTVELAYPDIARVEALSLQKYGVAIDDIPNCRLEELFSNRVKIDWTIDSTKVDGFEIYRNQRLIATVGNDSTYFIDNQSIPESTNSYEIIAFVEREGIRFFSRPLSETITLGALPTPFNFLLETQANKGRDKLTWEYFSDEADEFIIYRGSREIGRVTGGNQSTYTFLHDYDATNNSTHYYFVEAVKEINNQTFESDRGQTCFSNNFPLPPNFPDAGGVNKVNHTALHWEYDPEIKIDYFEIYDGNANTLRVAKDLRNFDVITSPGTVTIKACREINANTYCNDAYSISISPTSKSETQVISKRGVASISVDGDKLAIGMPDAKRIEYYEYQDNNWEHKNFIHSTLSEKLGLSVAIQDNSLVTYDGSRLIHYNISSSNQLSFNSTIPLYEGLLNNNQFYTINVQRPRLSLAMTGGRLLTATPEFKTEVTHIILGPQPNLNEDFSIRNYFKLDGGVYSSNFSTASGPSANFWAGWDMAVDNGIIVAGNIGKNGRRGEIVIHELNNPASTTALPASISKTDAELGYSVDISGDYIIGGSSNLNRVFIFKKDGSDWTEQTVLSAPSGLNITDYGEKVALHGDVAAILAINRNNNDSWIRVYKKGDGEDWNHIKDFDMGSNTSLENTDMVMNDKFIFSSDDDNLYFHSLLNAPENLTSNDETLNELKLNWDYEELQVIDGFKIYRDGEFIGNAGRFNTDYADKDGIPGKTYTYQVAAYAGGQESKFVTVKGRRKAAGEITGSVKTLAGNAPVSGATVTLSGIVYSDVAKTEVDRVVSRETTTNGNGEFTFEEIYYGAHTTEFTVLANYKDHVVRVAPGVDNRVSLSNEVKNAGNINFFDEVALAIVGRVTHKGLECGIDSVTVKAWAQLENSEPVFKAVQTDKDGNYSLTVDPGQFRLERIFITIDSQRIVSNPNSQPDSTLFRFEADADTIFQGNADFEALTVNEITTVNFEQTITYPISIALKNACQYPITGERFKIRIRDLEGCYDEEVTLDMDGEGTVNIPPLDGLTFTAIEAINNTTIGSVVLDYLKFRPAMLDLLTVHKDHIKALKERNKNGLALAEIEANLLRNSTVNLTFHVTPTIQVANFGEFVCSEFPHKIRQDDSIAVNFEVSELIGGLNCEVQEGFVIINNPAATVEGQLDTLYYDAFTNRFPTYQFLAGVPNIVAPFTWGMELSYFTESGSFLKRVTVPIVVEGSSAVPGYDIIVDPDDELIPYPLYILRDPPGDNSSTTIQAGKTFNRTVNHGLSQGGGYKHVTKNDFKLFGVGAGTEITVDVKAGASQDFSFNISGTLTESISTSSGNLAIGEAGDIIVGMGIAYQYGLIETVNVEECEVVKRTELGFTPSSVATKWVLTVAQIEKLITDNKGRAKDIEALPEAKRKEKEKERVVLENTAKNWEEVLIYHREKTLPHLAICNMVARQELALALQDSLQIDPNSLQIRIDLLNEWQENFCNQYGQPDITWDDAAVNTYNNLMASVRHILDARRSLAEIQAFAFDPNRWRVKGGYTDAVFTNQFGQAAENTTFSANTSITRILNLARSSSSTYGANASFGLNLATSIESKTETVNTVGTFVGIGAGVTTEVSFTTSEAKIEFSPSVNFEISTKHSVVKSVEESTSMSYTLSDDDAGDQHSVTVVQGIAPTHSPYFYRFGGRSSCPPEDGTIFRDAPFIQIIDPETGTAKKALQLYDQDPNEPVSLTVRITNNNPFNEARFMTAYLDDATNGNGARLKIAGSILGEVDLFNKIPSGVPQDFTLTLEKNIAYQYENIKIGVWASCGGPNQAFDEIDLSVYFETPCSPVTIVSPDNNWVANGVDDTLIIRVRDYQPDNTVFENLKLQYRRAEVGDDWDDVNVNELLVDFGDIEIPGFDPPYSEQRNPTAEFLKAYNERFVGTPSYPFVWAIPNNVVSYPDGNYEVRVVATCEAAENPSNVISGRIDRSALRLLSTPEPSDGLWLKGDELKAAFNQNLDCALLSLPQNFDIKIVDKSNNDAAVLFTPVCFNNELTFDLGLNDNFMDDFSVMETYDGHTLEVIIAQATAAVSGNQLLDTIRWEFDVVTQKLYWATDTINVELYADELFSFSVDLIETPDIQDNLPNVSLVAKDGSIDNWLTIDVPNVAGLVFDPDPAGKTIQFTIDGAVGPSEVMETIEVNGLGGGNKPTLVIKAKILNRSPNWVVNTAAYNETMNMIANWRFTTEEETAISLDTMDIISVWIDGTLRGTAQVEFTGQLGFYAAYLTIYGNESDEGKPVEFRVWDAQPGVEYSATNMDDPITFEVDAIIGSTAIPEMLLVDEEQSRIRYIPLKQGWTGFSLNLQKGDNSLATILGNLANLTTGDKIKTLDKFATYDENQGWITSNNTAGLPTLNPLEGYQIYLQNGPDTLAITGANASLSNGNDLNAGWNWIGFPLQESKRIQDAMVFVPPLANNSVLKTVNRIAPNGADLFLEYTNGTWSPPNKELAPYDFIKIKVNNGAGTTLTYDNTTPLRAPEEDAIAEGRGNPIADPNNQTTWQIGDANWEYTVPLVATISFNGVKSINVNDRIAVFVGNDLRGVGNLESLAGLPDSLVSISIGATTIGETYELYYYNAVQNKIYEIEQTLNFEAANNAQASLGFGDYTNPYPLEIALFVVTVEKQDVLCTADNSGFIEITPVGAFSPTYEWSHSDTETSNRVEGLLAGTYLVTITDTRNTPVVQTIEIANQAANLLPPTISGIAPVCQGEALILTASSEAFPNATFNWYDVNNNLIVANNTQLNLNNLQQSRTIKAIAVVNNICFSDAKSEIITVNQATDATFTANTRTPAANSQAVVFTPTVQDNATTYNWDFGDGNTSTDMVPQHVYTTLGTYTVTLSTTVAGDCSATNVSVNYITVGESDNCAADNPTMSFTEVIPSGDYHAVTSITSTGQVMANSTVTFTAGQNITLSPGFSAAANSEFLARIAPCPETIQPEVATTSRNSVTVPEKIAATTTLSIAPNPSSGLTNLSFDLSEADNISLSIFDATGVLVKQLIRDEFYQKGNYQIQYQPNHQAYGLYYVILQKDKELIKKKLILVR